MKENISNQKGIRMFKYEEEINAANLEYQNYLKDEDWAEIADLLAFHGDGCIKGEIYNNISRFSINTRIAITKYYTFVEGQGYVRTKESNFIDRSDRDKFEKNNIEYPKTHGLYMIGQTFINPITNEKFYWIKVGEAQNLARRRRDYNSMTAMIWDIGYYIKNDLTESECHDRLKDIALHRHVDEWFSVSRENYLKICEQGFEWFKEDE